MNQMLVSESEILIKRKGSERKECYLVLSFPTIPSEFSYLKKVMSFFSQLFGF